MMANFNLEDIVSTATLSNVVIKGVREIDAAGGMIVTYIVEHPSGWSPCDARKVIFNLDENKKYLFIDENDIL